jgi:hypothetical protein
MVEGSEVPGAGGSLVTHIALKQVVHTTQAGATQAGARANGTSVSTVSTLSPGIVGTQDTTRHVALSSPIIGILADTRQGEAAGMTPWQPLPLQRNGWLNLLMQSSELSYQAGCSKSGHPDSQDRLCES